MSTWISGLTVVGEAESRELWALPAETTQLARAVIGDAAMAWAAQTAHEVCAEIEAAARADSSIPVGMINREATQSALVTLLVSLERGSDVAVLPADALVQARWAARRGQKLDEVLRIIWLAHSALLDRLFEELSRGVPSNRLVREARALSEHMAHFVDLLARDFPLLYERERANWLDRPSAQRRQFVDAIVERGEIPEQGLDRFALRSTDHFLAAAVRTASVSQIAENPPDVRRLAASVERATGARSQLIVERADLTEIIWSFASPPDGAIEVASGLGETLHGATVGIGAPGRGAAGFRSTVIGAREAHRVGRLYGRPGVWAYGDVALFASLTTDAAAARQFIRHTLGGLTGADDRTAMLRETLGSYLRHGRSRLAAAHELHVAPNTVAYRVQRAESLLTNTSLDSPAVGVALDLVREFPALLHDERPH